MEAIDTNKGNPTTTSNRKILKVIQDNEEVP